MSADEALEAACARALAKHRDAQHAEILERLDRIESRLPPLFGTYAFAAKVLGVSIATIKRRVADGTLASISVGNTRRIDLSRVKGLDGDQIAELAARLHAA